MRLTLFAATLEALFAVSCFGEPLTPQDALFRYLASSADRQAQCLDKAFAINIEASLPKLKKEGAMSGLRLISRTGQIIYRALRFTGDNVVKTNVIGRFLSNDAAPREPVADTAVTERNYSFSFYQVALYNTVSAYVFRVKPKRKRVGLFRGELWLDATTAAPLRFWGDSVKAPSIFVRSLRVVQDYQTVGECQAPLRLLISVQTRIVGQAEMAMWLHPVEAATASAGATVAEVVASAPRDGGPAAHDRDWTTK